MKAFLDTNIILDLLLQRDGFELSAEILSRQEAGLLQTSTSVLSMINVAYVYRKTVGEALAVVNLKYISELVSVLPMDNSMLQDAIFAQAADFEDVFQAACAARSGCDCIITRNIKDFVSMKSSSLSFPPAFTPEEFLRTM